MTWTFSCLHASIIKDENDDSMFSYNIYQCCGSCEFPAFSLCALADYPNWLCGSEAYDCVFSCRDEDSVLEAVISAGSLGTTRKRELNITDAEVRRSNKLAFTRTRVRRHPPNDLTIRMYKVISNRNPRKMLKFQDEIPYNSACQIQYWRKINLK